MMDEDLWRGHGDNLLQGTISILDPNLVSRVGEDTISSILSAFLDVMARPITDYSAYSCFECEDRNLVRELAHDEMARVRQRAGECLFNELHGGTPLNRSSYKREISKLIHLTALAARYRDLLYSHTCVDTDPQIDYDPPF